MVTTRLSACYFTLVPVLKIWKHLPNKWISYSFQKQEKDLKKINWIRNCCIHVIKVLYWVFSSDSTPSLSEKLRSKVRRNKMYNLLDCSKVASKIHLRNQLIQWHVIQWFLQLWGLKPHHQCSHTTCNQNFSTHSMGTDLMPDYCLLVCCKLLLCNRQHTAYFVCSGYCSDG